MLYSSLQAPGGRQEISEVILGFCLRGHFYLPCDSEFDIFNQKYKIAWQDKNIKYYFYTKTK
jgi:hypothetical protein